MENRELKPFIEDEIYPLTIISDRYTGAYSGGEYLAFNLDFDEIPRLFSAICIADALEITLDELCGRGKVYGKPR